MSKPASSAPKDGGPTEPDASNTVDAVAAGLGTGATWIDTAPFERQELAPGESQATESQSPRDWQAGALPVLRPDNRYALGGEIARGGLGRVLRAQDRRLARTVAIKELLHQKGDHVRRFLREAQVTAALEHPSIVPIHDVGRWPDGVPFYAMKLVQGRSLDDVVRATRRLEDRLALIPNLVAVAEALSYAHSNGVIHRDLKPLNVMLGAFGETLVIDWGLAKHVNDAADTPEDEQGPAAPGERGLTQVGSVIGTPDFMAPEQARGESVGARADVYALGAILYFTLAGAPPYPEGNSRQTWKRVLAGAPPRLEKREPNVPPDLLAIVVQAMARDPAARYPSATELAADLRRFETGQLVGARRYSRIDLVRRTIRRHRAAFAVAGIAALLLASAGLFSLRRIASERDAARAGRLDAETQRSQASSARDQAQLRGDRLVLLQARSQAGSDPTAAIGWLKRYPLGAADWAMARDIAEQAVSRGVARHVWSSDAPVTAVAFSADGRRLVSAGRGAEIMVREPDSGRVWSLTGVAAARGLAVSADGDRVAVAGDDGSLHLFEVDGGGHDVVSAGARPLLALRFGADGRLVAVSSDGLVRRIGADGSVVEQVLGAPLADAVVLPGGDLVVVGADGAVKVTGAGAGAARAGRRLPAGTTVTWMGASADANVVVVGDAAGRLTVWRGREQRVLIGHDGPITAGAVSLDGRHVATGGEDETLRLWDLERGGARVVAVGGVARVIAFSPDGTRAVAGTMAGMVHVVATAGDMRVLTGHGAPVWSLAFTPDGRWLATGSEEGSVRLWDLTMDRGREVARVQGPMPGMARSRDGKWLAGVSPDGIVVWSASGAARGVLPLPASAAKVVDLAIADGGASVVTLHADGGVQIRARSASGWHDARVGAHGASGVALAISADGLRVATLGADRKVWLWDATDGAPSGKTSVPIALESDAQLMAFSPDGSMLAVGGTDGLIHRWRVGAPADERLVGHRAQVRALAFAPDGRVLASGSYDGTVRLWREGGKDAVVLKDHLGPVLSLAFAADGQRLASGGVDGVLRIWDVATQQLAQRLRGGGALVDLCFDANGAHLAAASLQGPLRLWDLERAASETLASPRDKVRACAFAGGGRALVCAAETGHLRLWGLDEQGGVAGALPTDPAELLAWLGVVTSAAIDDSDGEEPQPRSPKR